MKHEYVEKLREQFLKRGYADPRDTFLYVDDSKYSKISEVLRDFVGTRDQLLCALKAQGLMKQEPHLETVRHSQRDDYFTVLKFRRNKFVRSSWRGFVVEDSAVPDLWVDSVSRDVPAFALTMARLRDCTAPTRYRILLGYLCKAMAAYENFDFFKYYDIVSEFLCETEHRDFFRGRIGVEDVFLHTLDATTILGDVLRFMQSDTPVYDVMQPFQEGGWCIQIPPINVDDVLVRDDDSDIIMSCGLLIKSFKYIAFIPNGTSRIIACPVEHSGDKFAVAVQWANLSAVVLKHAGINRNDDESVALSKGCRYPLSTPHMQVRYDSACTDYFGYLCRSFPDRDVENIFSDAFDAFDWQSAEEAVAAQVRSRSEYLELMREE